VSAERDFAGFDRDPIGHWALQRKAYAERGTSTVRACRLSSPLCPHGSRLPVPGGLPISERDGDSSPTHAAIPREQLQQFVELLLAFGVLARGSDRAHTSLDVRPSAVVLCSLVLHHLSSRLWPPQAADGMCLALDAGAP
jgi:hypothetical protein